MSGISLKASDPIDFVYSHSRLISDILQQRLTVDYARPLDEVYTDLAEAIILDENYTGTIFMGCMRTCSLGSSPYSPELPSWVPDWSSTDIGRLNFNPTNPGGMYYSRAKIIRDGSGKRIMQTRVRWIDKVRWARNIPNAPLSEMMTSSSTAFRTEPIAAVHRFHSFIREAVEPFVTSGECLDKILFEISMAYNRPGTFRSRPTKGLYESYRFFRSAEFSNKTELSSSLYFRAVFRSIISCLFQTEGGRFGVSLFAIQPGDQITDIWALRPDGLGRFKMISPLHLLDDELPDDYPETSEDDEDDSVEGDQADGSSSEEEGNSSEEASIPGDRNSSWGDDESKGYGSDRMGSGKSKRSLDMDDSGEDSSDGDGSSDYGSDDDGSDMETIYIS